MSPTSPTSPSLGLRRRGRQSGEGMWPAEAGTSKQPVSPTHHTRSSSTLSDGFGDFVGSEYAQHGEKERQNPISIDDDWQDADFVQSFSPVAGSSQLPPFAPVGASTALNAPDWDAWETPRGPTPQPGPGAGNASTSVDDAFFAAFERATVAQQQQRPSPPMIDLREMEKKLEGQKRASEGLHPVDLDFFESFEKSPGEVMSSSREKADANASLQGSQLDSMKEAQASPMQILSPGNNQPRVDYFDDQDLLTDTVQQNGNGVDHVTSPSRADSWSDAAGQWAGTFRKTLGTLRGQAAELTQHLPSSKDFIVPEGEGDEEILGEHDQENGRQDAVKEKSKPRRIAKAADHSQSSPFGTSSGSVPAASPPRQNLRQGSGTGGTLHRPIKGAPGFDLSSTHNWNTGSWSLSSTEESKRSKKPIPVQLKGRWDETQDVLGKELAAHLTAHLPKRMQLGKTWKLLYSSDQHGISLGTLYWKVQSGLEISNGGRKSDVGGGLSDAEGWLRGASQSTKEAVTGIRRVGGGLNLSEAGLILAVRDGDDNVFGAYVNERLRPQSSYYGNGECFLWKATDDSAVQTFQWTGRNDYMVLTEPHYLSFGGGDGKYGLWLDGQLEKGVSSRCPAFDNDVLCTSGQSASDGQFECITLEVWACGID